jgi:hypothetical protein
MEDEFLLALGFNFLQRANDRATAINGLTDSYLSNKLCNPRGDSHDISGN